MTDHLPYRTHLVDLPPADQDEREAYMQALRVALEPHRASDRSIVAAAKHPSEFVSFSLAANYSTLEGTARDDTVAAEIRSILVRKALAQARAEDLVWTPVIDELVSRGIWMQAHLAWKRQEDRGEEIPSPEELAESLDDWIKSRSNPDDLAPLLEFRSWSVVRRVAAFASNIDENLIWLVSTKAPSAMPELAENPNLNAAARAELAIWAWDHMIGDQTKPIKYYPEQFDTDAALECFEILAGHPEGLAAHVKEDFLDHQEKEPPNQRLHAFLAALVKDVNLTDTEFTRIAKIIMGKSAVKVLADPRCTEEQQEEIFERTRNQFIAEDIFLEENSSERLLRAAYDLPTASRPSCILALLRHPNCPKDLADEILRTQILGSEQLALEVLSHPRYANDPECRELFRRSHSPFILQKLMKVAPPEEFSETLLALIRVDPKQALDLLAQDDTLELLIKEEDLVPLLTHENTEIRLRAIGLLPQFKSEQAEEREPTKEIPPPSQERIR